MFTVQGIRRSSKRALAGLLFLGLIATQVGFCWLAGPGDCAVDGEGWLSANGGCQDPSGRVWGASRIAQGGPAATHTNAKSYCANLVEGGFSDWRLPAKAEFQTAVSYSAASHLNLPDQGWGRWLNETKGKRYGYFGIFQDGSIHETLQTSLMDSMCVR